MCETWLITVCWRNCYALKCNAAVEECSNFYQCKLPALWGRPGMMTVHLCTNRLFGDPRQCLISDKRKWEWIITCSKAHMQYKGNLSLNVYMVREICTNLSTIDKDIHRNQQIGLLSVVSRNWEKPWKRNGQITFKIKCQNIHFSSRIRVLNNARSHVSIHFNH